MGNLGRLQLLQRQLENLYTRPFHFHNGALEAQLTSQFTDLWQNDEAHWRQQSRVRWLEEGD